jgi:anti-sigma regulatory factor (Ser/Thr protein kinase)
LNHLDAAFPCAATSAKGARAVVVETLRGWGLDALADDAELVTGELVTNAVLHAGTPVGLLLSHDAGELTIEVRDEYGVDFGLPPLPAPGPVAASVAPDDLDVLLSSESMTGRGLTLVAALVDEWGIDVDATGKTVWVAMRAGDAPAGATSGRARVAPAAPGTATGREAIVTLLAVPTAVVLANIANLDDRVRELALLDRDHAPASLLATADALAASARATAIGRLRGRRAARAAAARGEAVFTTAVPGDPTAADALEQLGQALARLDDLARAGHLLAPPASPAVYAFREWVVAEVRHQLAGAPPTPYPA